MKYIIVVVSLVIAVGIAAVIYIWPSASKETEYQRDMLRKLTPVVERLVRGESVTEVTRQKIMDVREGNVQNGKVIFSDDQMKVVLHETIRLPGCPAVYQVEVTNVGKKACDLDPQRLRTSSVDAFLIRPQDHAAMLPGAPRVLWMASIPPTKQN